MILFFILTLVVYVIDISRRLESFVVLCPAGDFVHHPKNERLENFEWNDVVEILRSYPICAKDD